MAVSGLKSAMVFIVDPFCFGLVSVFVGFESSAGGLDRFMSVEAVGLGGWHPVKVRPARMSTTMRSVRFCMCQVYTMSMSKHKSVKNSPVIVILHGWVSSELTANRWQPFRDELHRSGFETEFLLIPGLDTQLNQPWTLADYNQWLGEQLTQLQHKHGQRKLVLLGHSFGGQIALAHADQLNNIVSGLVLIDSAGLIDRRWHKVMKRTVFSTLAKLAHPLKFVPFARKLVYKLLGEHDYLDANPIQRQIMAAVITQEVLTQASELSIPTLIIWGEMDTATPMFMGQKLFETIPDAQLVTIAGARHSPQYTHTTQVAQAVDEFIWHKLALQETA